MFTEELSHFLSCLKGEEQEIVSVSDGVDVLKVCLAAKESIRTGSVVNV